MPKIIQLVVSKNTLLGLGDDGVVYYDSDRLREWAVYKPLAFEDSAKAHNTQE